MIDVAFTQPSDQRLASSVPEQRHAHVLVYQRQLLHKLRDGRRATETADRYVAAQASAHTGPAFAESVLAEAVTAAQQAVTLAQQGLADAKSKKAKTSARRVLKAATVKLTRAQGAAKTEGNAEKLAPEVQRRPVLQDGIVLREPRVEITAGKRAELQPALERLHNRRAINARQFGAGSRYRAAWEIAGLGAFGGGGIDEGAGCGAPSSGNGRIENAVGSSDELVAARYAVGVSGTALLEHVVIEGLTLEAWGAKRGENDQVCKGQLHSVLNRLAEHWETPRRPRVAQTTEIIE